MGNSKTRRNYKVLPTSGIIVPDEPVINDPYQMFGFAKTGGVTGGAGGPTVVCTTWNQLYSQLYKRNTNANDPKIILISGNLVAPSYINKDTGLTEFETKFYCGGNKTIIGLPGSSMNFGLAWWPDAESPNANNNVIVRNLMQKDMWNKPGSDTKDNTDYLVFKMGADKVWVDHCEAIGSPGSDGHVDMGVGMKYATMSYCKITNEDKACLLSSDYLTYAFNHNIDGSERGPSFSYGKADIFNNLYETTVPSNSTLLAGHAIGLRYGAHGWSHGNVFKNFIPHPHRTLRIADPANPGTYFPYSSIAQEDNLRINSPASDQFTYHGDPVTWRPPTDFDYHRNYLKSSADTEAWVRSRAGQTLTLEDMELAA